MKPITNDTPESRLMDHLKEILLVRMDKQLAFIMGVAPDKVYGLRHRRFKFGPKYQLKVLELTGWTVKQLNEFMKRG